MKLLSTLMLALVCATGPVQANQLASLAEVRPQLRPIPDDRAMVVSLQGSRLTVGGDISAVAKVRPRLRKPDIPRTRWQHMRGHELWTRAALVALETHGRPLIEVVPRDIRHWCPAYPEQDASKRAAFWVGFMSALAKHESTYRPGAVGGGGKWYGLLQILPATARGYKCHVGTGEALRKGAANLSCAARIMAHTVPRDGVIHGYRKRKGQGVTADWGPMHNANKRADMARWTRRQSYCQQISTTRPRVRPDRATVTD